MFWECYSSPKSDSLSRVLLSPEKAKTFLRRRRRVKRFTAAAVEDFFELFKLEEPRERARREWAREENSSEEYYSERREDRSEENYSEQQESWEETSEQRTRDNRRRYSCASAAHVQCSIPVVRMLMHL